MGINTDDSTVLYMDEPTLGGYAGITLSPDYGLFTLSGGHRTQVVHYSGSLGDYVHAVYLNATDHVVTKGGPDSSTSELLESVGGGPLTTLDTAAGNFGDVFLVTGH